MTKHRFPADCPAFLLLDRDGFFMVGNKPGEIVEGTFNDQGSTIMLGFARAEKWQDAFGWPSPTHALRRWRTPYFLANPDNRDGPWQGAWHYTGRLVPLTRAAREMLAVCGVTTR